LPAVQAAREAARRMQCTNNLKQLMLAVHNYHNTHRTMPLGSLGQNVDSHPGWGFMILPFIEQTALNNRAPDYVDFFQANGGGVPRVDAFLCPSTSTILNNISMSVADTGGVPKWFVSHYFASLGVWKDSTWNMNRSNGLFPTHNAPHDFAAVTDGLSNTWAIGEVGILADTCWCYHAWCVGYTEGFGRYATAGAVYSTAADSMSATGGNTNAINGNHGACIYLNNNSVYSVPAGGPGGFYYGSLHPGGANFAMGDGSVSFYSDSTDAKILWALATRNGGELLQPGQ
jgi:prepilin-type processing-associated H-X9-DG protein